MQCVFSIHPSEMLDVFSRQRGPWVCVVWVVPRAVLDWGPGRRTGASGPRSHRNTSLYSLAGGGGGVGASIGAPTFGFLRERWYR